MDTLFMQTGLEEPDDIPQTTEPVWILGKKYDAIKELDQIRRDVRTMLWFTYRKGFVPIGGLGSAFTSDKGWGCMLRCGQMVLAQALLRLHLDWLWTPETRDSTYLKILSKFEDRRGSPFSIHQIALMGASVGKEVGQWFGPNTVAQVLKKLVVYDKWSSITIHVALDNMLIVNDVLKECRVEGGMTAELDGDEPLKVPSEWKPLLLLVPLRLGLSEINTVYINGLKTSFQIPQSLGVIGGKPNHALYFIGCVEDEVVFLDPHTTQRSGTVDEKKDENQVDLDNTYHCKAASRIPITGIDPSVALCFFCSTEKDFKALCKSLQSKLLTPEEQPMFEMCNERPANWSSRDSVVTQESAAVSVLGFEHLDRHYDTSDEDFELLG
ncbi:cysteine protease ATG4B isoform X2 [Orussus abietinus]|uniref:cysteine protease ATG4B isoform X2 n=1 Tax=Orussus abietinus TaxID=222816 RepID=UPI00062576A2|nr:cysteine protease ATG4B isoform X2 [Orussus abietinus]